MQNAHRRTYRRIDNAAGHPGTRRSASRVSSVRSAGPGAALSLCPEPTRDLAPVFRTADAVLGNP
ncbi:hypothetical protein STRIP9103_08455 [Streptomyces ipomoeae 91-03]|uniref:Uncharacterized protein n=1 Tax=Streptomyces ipomoeae 91-03 TaxID=698759 RepID=L1KVS2_9ACTN|nr:hypothetical protein STRIP9103_08455 [Streptomyces ipomoeae 91-03]